MSSSVAVIVPCFNQARFLGEALASIQGQSFAPSEVVVVDDGSTDGTAEVAAGFPGVRCVRQARRGLAGARNRGLAESSADLVVFLDADDRLRPHALATGVAALAERPDHGFVYGRCVRIDDRGRQLPTLPPPQLRGHHYTALLGHNFIWTPAVVMFDRRRCGRLLYFDRRVDASADYQLYLRLARRLPIDGHGEVVAEYRRHDGSMSRHVDRMLVSTLHVLRAERRHLRTDGERRAWRTGFRTWQTHYGEQVLEELRQAVRDRRWKPAVRYAGVLARYYPLGLTNTAARQLERALAVRRQQV